MYGFYICQPFAKQIIDGKKKYELRNWKTTRLNDPFYLLTENKECLGIISFEYIIETNQEYKYAFRVKVIEQFKKPKKYFHPLGAVRWVKNVKFL